MPLPEMALGVMVHNAIVSQYVQAYGSLEQKQRWLPGLVKVTHRRDRDE
jgi:alkylation response protein AidB-like acyl-CoA dehydrogenase